MSVTTISAEVGPMITGNDIEQALIAVLKAWLPSYLAEAERQHGWPVGKTPAPRGYVQTGVALEKWPQDQLPCIVIMAGGINTKPRVEGSPGTLTAIWNVQVGAIFSSAWGDSSRAHSQLYAAAIRTCLIQRPLESVRAEVDYQGEIYDLLDFDEGRTYSASVVSFAVNPETSVGPAAGRRRW